MVKVSNKNYAGVWVEVMRLTVQEASVMIERIDMPHIWKFEDV